MRGIWGDRAATIAPARGQIDEMGETTSEDAGGDPAARCARHSAAQGDAVRALVDGLRELLGGRAPRERLSLGQVLKVLNAQNPDAPEPSRPDLMAALRELANEDDPVISLGGGAARDSVLITGNGLRLAAADY